MAIKSVFTQSNYFSSYIDIQAIVAPSNPNSGIGRIYHNSADNKLYFKKSDGTDVDLESGAGGEANTYSNAGVGGVGITLTKTGSDLPFKSINTANSNNITVTNDAGNNEIDLDIGSAVSTASNTQTLSKKSMSGASNTFTAIPNTALDQITDKAKLHSSIAYEDEINTFTKKQIFNVEAGDFNAMEIYRPVNTSGNASIIFYLQDSLSNKTDYARIGARSITVTDGAEVGAIWLEAMQGGILTYQGRISNNKLHLGASNNLILAPTGLDANTEFLFPNEMGQTVLGDTATQTITNKTINADSNTITNIENADIKAAAGIVYSKLTLTNSIVDADIATHTTTKITTTSKSLLNSAIVYNDQNNDLGAFYFDMAAISTPANPSANDGRFFIEAIDANNDGLFCHIKKNGAFVKLLVF